MEVVFEKGGITNSVSVLDFINETEIKLQPPSLSQKGIYDVYLKAIVRKGSTPKYSVPDEGGTLPLTTGAGYSFASNKSQIEVL
jgi:hypothetical protein